MAESVLLQGTRGRELIVRFDINAYAAVERELGRSISSIFSDEEKSGLDVLRVLLWAGTKWSFRGMTIERAGQIIEEFIEDYKSVEKINEVIQKAVVNSGLYELAESETGGGNADSPNGKGSGSSQSEDGSDNGENEDGENEPKPAKKGKKKTSRAGSKK